MGVDRFRRLETGEQPIEAEAAPASATPPASAPPVGRPSPVAGPRARSRFGQLERDGELAERKTALETADRLLALERERANTTRTALVAAPFVAAPFVIGLMALIALRCA